MSNIYTAQELAEKLNISVRTLSRWHNRRIGPTRSKIGNFIAYRSDAVEEWLKNNEVHPVNYEGARND